jgi:structural maintenance of chromosome 2
MEYIFGSTLICADKDSAQKVTFDPSIRMKSVTLEGDVYDPSGTLSGGSAPNTSGLLIKMAQLRDLKLQRAALQSELEKIDKELSALTAFSSKVGKLSSELQLKEHALGLLHTQLSKSVYKQLLDSQTELNNTIEEARQTITSATERQQIATRKCSQIEKDMKEYADHRESKLASIRNQISLLKKSLDDSSKAYNVFQKELQVLGCEIETFEKDLVKVREQLVQAEEVRVGHVQELEALEKELAGVQVGVVFLSEISAYVVLIFLFIIIISSNLTKKPVVSLPKNKNSSPNTIRNSSVSKKKRNPEPANATTSNYHAPN